jgi:putative membrane protein insertion efficiency factor
VTVSGDRMSAPASAAAAGGAPARRPGLATRAACAAVCLYRRAFAGRPSPCRFWPTCSSYALEALHRHGFWGGGRLTVRRLARCRPWGGHGVDLVPERASR